MLEKYLILNVCVCCAVVASQYNTGYCTYAKRSRARIVRIMHPPVALCCVHICAYVLCVCVDLFGGHTTTATTTTTAKRADMRVRLQFNNHFCARVVVVAVRSVAIAHVCCRAEEKAKEHDDDNNHDDNDAYEYGYILNIHINTCAHSS